MKTIPDRNKFFSLIDPVPDLCGRFLCENSAAAEQGAVISCLIVVASQDFFKEVCSWRTQTGGLSETSRKKHVQGFSISKMLLPSMH